tara:strand:- start:447 stop:704 length:258 start_codon:yes stop_codon:yes gene_type:complete
MVFGVVRFHPRPLIKQKEKTMTKKHFVKLAKVISENVRYDGYNDYGIRYDNFLNELIEVCKETNPLFNEKVFRNAIKLKTLKKVR